MKLNGAFRKNVEYDFLIILKSVGHHYYIRAFIHWKKRTDVLPQDRVKSRSREIQV